MSNWCASASRVVAPAHRANAPEPAFELTTRWLRGRIIERLRALDEGAWEWLPATIGEHGSDEVEVAVAALRREGLLEQRLDGAVRLPSE